uniref:protein xylosyltransferase n=1 Tax=Lynceus sp. MCZ IZ 141354 TaxID=1930659 RepID=A0A9N6ZEF7_9CRUS|nr:EOG090X01AN [Lynceus sp. MCZ IZ 141354]
MWRIGERPLPEGLRIDGGSDWVGLNRKFVDYILKSNPLVEGLKSYFNYTLLPAESFFHIVLLNSEHCQTSSDNNLRTTLWKRSQGCLCQHKHIVDWCGCSPMVFRIADWSRIEVAMDTQNNVFFARKFDPTIDSFVLSQIESRSFQSNHFDSKYWESTYHKSDLKSPPKALLMACDVFVEIVFAQLKCELQNNFDIIETTSYFSRDLYQGELMKFRFYQGNLSYVAEAWIKPNDDEFLVHPVTKIVVSSDYDPKEQVHRNRFRILSSTSKPTLLLKLTPPFNLTFVEAVWVDPLNVIRTVDVINVTEHALVHSKQYNSEMSPGLWSVLVLDEDKLLAKTDFIVMKTKETVLNLRGNSTWQQTYSKFISARESLSWGHFDKKIRNSNEVESDSLRRLGDTLKEFYSVVDVCFDGSVAPCVQNGVLCASTQWSSLSPDPKSNL